MRSEYACVQPLVLSSICTPSTSQTYVSFSVQSRTQKVIKGDLNLKAVTPHTSLVGLDKFPAVRFALSRCRFDETVIPSLLGLRAGATSTH